MNLLVSRFIFFFAQSNDPVVKRIEDKVLIEALSAIENQNRYEAQDFSVSILKRANAPRSAGIPGGHEISHSYYVVISEFDEYPETSLFNVGGFYNPKMSISENDDFATMTVEFGAFNNRITKKYTIELHALTELK